MGSREGETSHDPIAAYEAVHRACCPKCSTGKACPVIVRIVGFFWR